MLKGKNKFLLAGIVLNIIVAVLNIIYLIGLYLPLFFEKIPIDNEIEVTNQWMMSNMWSLFIQVCWLILVSFMLLNVIISIVGFVRKNNDLILISICVSAIFLILNLIFKPFGIVQIILLIVMFVALLVGYIIEKRKEQTISD